MRYNVCQCDKDAKEEREISEQKEKRPFLVCTLSDSSFSVCVCFFFYYYYFGMQRQYMKSSYTTVQYRTSYQQQYRMPLISLCCCCFCYVLYITSLLRIYSLLKTDRANRENKIRAKRKKNMWKGNPMPNVKRMKKNLHRTHRHIHTHTL